ncbi:hypothetical protein ABMA27_000826 [Loxostege sticticalis]|uniref:Uncharacterized protein n=1 Tax=Loxostege sticticalis TaxID=481309 RepID=A0ABR3I0G6_LOXSC
MSVRVDHRDRDRFSRHSSRASVDLAFPSSSTRDHSLRSVHSARVPRAASDDLMVPVRTLRSASCRVAPGAPHRLRRHHSSAAECERARRSRRHTLELPNSRGPSVRSRSPEPPPPPPEPEVPPEDAGKEARRRRVVAAVAASFFALALASVLVVVVTLTHSSVLRAHNQTANPVHVAPPSPLPLRMRLSPTLSARGCERRRVASTARHRHHTRYILCNTHTIKQTDAERQMPNDLVDSIELNSKFEDRRSQEAPRGQV